VCLALLAIGSSALGGELLLKGRVVDERGFPLTQSRVYLEGARRGSVATDKDGWYSFKLDVPPLEQLQRAPVEFTVAAYRRDWAVSLLSGLGWKLHMEIAAEPDTDRVLCYEIRSNDSTAAVQLAETTVLEGQVAGTLMVHFLGGVGEQPNIEEPLTNLQKVRVTGAAKAGSDPVAATVAPAAAATSKPHPPPSSSTTAPPVSPPLLAPVSRAAVPQYAPGCTCRVKGTVEVNSPRLNDPIDVVVWLESAPRDSQSVHMFMGAPREFDLTARGCGAHLLRYAVRSRSKQLYQAKQEVIVDCTERGLRQPRLVLEPYFKKR
jgi:hypothetical protein